MREFRSGCAITPSAEESIRPSSRLSTEIPVEYEAQPGCGSLKLAEDYFVRQFSIKLHPIET